MTRKATRSGPDPFLPSTTRPSTVRGTRAAGSLTAALVVAAWLGGVAPAATAGPVAARTPQASSGRGAFFLADRPTTATYVPADQHVQSGSSIVVTRQSKGVYRAVVPDMADKQAGLAVSTVGTRAGVTCDPQSWSPSGAAEVVSVSCVGPAGAAVDAAWNAVLTAGLPVRAARVQSAAARVDGTGSVPTVQHDDAGGVITVKHLGPGSYEVTVPGFPASASVLAEAVDPLPGARVATVVQEAPGGPSRPLVVPAKHHLAVPRKHHLGTGLVVDVATAEVGSGQPADSAFFLSVVQRANAADDPTLTVGYGDAAAPAATKQIMSSAYDPAGGTPEVIRLGTGRYEATLPGLGSSAGVAQVGATSAGASSCTISGAVPRGGSEVVDVSCALGGVTTDRAFTLLWTALTG